MNTILDPAQEQSALIAEVVQQFRPLVVERLSLRGLASDIPLVLNEIRYQAWHAAINHPAPNVKAYVFGTIEVWIRTHLSRLTRQQHDQLHEIESHCQVPNPADVYEDSWNFQRLLKYMVRYLGEDTVQAVLAGNAHRHPRGRTQRLTRVILAACDLADATVTAAIDEIRDCLDIDDQQLIASSITKISIELDISRSSAQRRIRQAHERLNIAIQIYGEETRGVRNATQP